MPTRPKISDPLPETHLFFNLALWHAFLLYADFFTKSIFSKNSFRSTISLRVSNCLDLDQARHFVRPYLSQNCLQRLSADETTVTVKPIVSDQLKMDKTKVLVANDSLMKLESIAECSPWSILQYFLPALNDNWY